MICGQYYKDNIMRFVVILTKLLRRPFMPDGGRTGGGGRLPFMTLPSLGIDFIAEEDILGKKELKWTLRLPLPEKLCWSTTT
jgi:hypothetical protein